jgi:hypothetical protein
VGWGIACSPAQSPRCESEAWSIGQPGRRRAEELGGTSDEPHRIYSRYAIVLGLLGVACALAGFLLRLELVARYTLMGLGVLLMVIARFSFSAAMKAKRR